MKVKDVMTPDAKAIWITESLADAAKEMWENDCGALPIIKDGRKVVGMITDRDICIAGATRSRTEGEIPVRDVISRTLHACRPGDEIHSVMDTMKRQQVRRLPVIGQDGRLTGIISIHDIALQARPGKVSDLRAEEVLDTYIAITAPSQPRAAVPA